MLERGGGGCEPATAPAHAAAGRGLTPTRCLPGRDVSGVLFAERNEALQRAKHLRRLGREDGAHTVGSGNLSRD